MFRALHRGDYSIGVQPQLLGAFGQLRERHGIDDAIEN